MVTETAEDLHTFAEWIRKGIEQAGLDNLEVARRVRVNPNRLADWEEGRSLPPPEYVVRLAQVFTGELSATDDPNEIWLDDRGIAWLSDSNRKVNEIVGEHLAWGMTADRIQEGHPDLTLEQVVTALDYYAGHREQIDAELAADRFLSEALREQFEASPVSAKLRAAKLRR